MADPESLVAGRARRYGRFAERPASVNPLDEFTGLARRLRRLRLKEWIGFTLLHPDWYSSLIIQDAHYLASSEIYAYDRRSGALHQHAVNGRGGSLAMPALLAGGHCSFRRRGYRLEYDFAAGPGKRHTLRFDIAATPTAPAFQGELELEAGHSSAPLSVSSRLPGGRLYTHKAIFPAEGTLRVGDQKIAFDGTRDLAIIDEHSSMLPYRTTWLWGTFALRAADGIVGANFVDRLELAGQEEESCLWTPGRCEPLANIEFQQAGGANAPWHIFSRDGGLDVTFEPEGRKQVRHQLGIFAIDYFQLFGHYRGTLRSADRSRDIEGAHGVCESMRARL
jgi:Domain of unknown function (DUF2804), C-terminal/Domain of unknown function (DUF2804), N-terminal